MKAIVYREFGPPAVLQLDDVAKPSPKAHEVLIRVRAAPVNYGDLLARNLRNVTAREFNMPRPLLLPTRMYFGFTKPKVTILGSEFAGVIEAVGKGVTRYRVGEQVFGYRGQQMGTYAEYLCMAEDGLLATKPANMSFAEAATIPYGAIMATSLLRHGQIQAGHKVLINGASGSIGAAALQLAKAYGAEVTGVCGTPRLAYAKALGADRVIDYTVADFTQNGTTYDLIFDILGKCSFARCKSALTPHGILLFASFKLNAVAQMFWTKRFGSQKVICALASEKADDLVLVRDLIEAGQYKAIVDRCYPMQQAAEAHEYAESGQKQGSVVITFDQ